MWARPLKSTEIVGDELVLMTLTGGLHGYAVTEIAASLREYGRRTKRGYAFADNVGFIVILPNRRSFSPDAAFWTGGPLTGKFLEGAPIFAVEVKSEDDHGPAAERAMAEKRADYFAAGTLVVWDADVLKEQIVRVAQRINAVAQGVNAVVHGIDAVAQFLAQGINVLTQRLAQGIDPFRQLARTVRLLVHCGFESFQPLMHRRHGLHSLAASPHYTVVAAAAEQ